MSIEADISYAVIRWATVSPKWYPTGGSATPRAQQDRCRPHELAQAIFMESDAAPVFVGKCDKCKQPSAEYWDARRQLATKTCPICEGTVERRAPVAVLLHDAAEGNTAARDFLLTHADELQAKGNPLGKLLSWALLLWMRKSADLTHADEAVRWLEWLTAQHELLRNRNANGYVVTVDGFEYHVPVTFTSDSMTAAEIAAALNAQGGPATFTASPNGDAVVTTILHDATSSTLIVAGNIREADLLPMRDVPEEPTRRQHAPHIGSRLGRRLGVRR